MNSSRVVYFFYKHVPEIINSFNLAYPFLYNEAKEIMAKK